MYYFAYGVNMNHDSMATHCPNARFISSAVLSDHKIVFDGQSRTRGGGTANIVPSTENTVWGGVYKLTGNDLKLLDAFENFPVSYQKKPCVVTTPQHKQLVAITYFRVPQKPEKPSASYFCELLAGAVHCRLPPDYIYWLRECLGWQEYLPD